MARAIIRWSIGGEGSNVTGNAIRKNIKDASGVAIGTGAAEVEHLDLARVLDTVAGVISIVQNPPGAGELDHLWIYVDRTGAGN